MSGIAQPHGLKKQILAMWLFRALSIGFSAILRATGLAASMVFCIAGYSV